MKHYIDNLQCLILLTVLLNCISNNHNAQEEKSLSILCWNIHLLPGPIYARSKKKIRVEKIAKSLLQSDYDLLVFQEAFHNRHRNNLNKLLEANYPYSYGPNNRKSIGLKTNSGLFIMSRFPLQEIASIHFDDCKGSDCMARKGALLLRGEHNSKAFFLINTHANAAGSKSLNLKQFEAIKSQLILPYFSDTIPMIILGDMNVDLQDKTYFDKMIQIFNTNNNNHYDNRYEKCTSPILNTLDYCFIYNIGLAQHQYSRRVNTILIGPDWISNDKKKKYEETVGYSDHYPLEILFNWY